MTRTPETLADFSARGVTVRYADFDKPETLASAFADAERLLLTSTSDAIQGMRRFFQQVNAVKAAEDAGVRHVLYISLTNPDDTPITLAPDHRGTESALGASSMGWTILRNNVYADTLVAGLAQAAQMGALYSAAGDGRTSYVTREDCARRRRRAARAVRRSPGAGHHRTGGAVSG
ncbi:MAG: NAD(P)H-binding protein [Anaerolineae bacterium]